MAIHVALHHRTHYRYPRPVTLYPQVVRLRPAPHCRTRVLGYSLKIGPQPHFLNWQQDPQSNWLARLVFPEKVTEFLVEVDLVAEMAVHNPFDFFLEPAAEQFPFAYDPSLAQELAPFRVCHEFGPAYREFLAAVDRTPRRTIDFLVALNQSLQTHIRYVIRLEPGVYTPEECLAKREGSCRDSAWLFVNLARHLGFAARFVSGYLIQLAPDQKSLDGPSGAEADFTDLHAWAEVYLPGAGWIGFDPTSGLLAGEGHLPLACSPEPGSAAAITGALEPLGENEKGEFQVEMSVRRVYESPRTTKPYTEEEWAAIEALGHAIDRRLEAGDVRLTMGGEPTFISIDDMDGPEWNTLAVGPHKRKLSEELLKRLWRRFAPGGFLHYGQGKWYPGESLPRWSFAAYWRKDGQPLWEQPERLAEIERDYGFGPAEASAFLARLAESLGVRPDLILPAYEDAWYYAWRERRLPANVDPLKSNLADAEERTRLYRLFTEGLGQVRGYVLPLQRRMGPAGPVWAGGKWFLRDQHVFLLPGDSPIGLRLPLDSIAWAGREPDFVEPVHPWQELPPLPDRAALQAAWATQARVAGHAPASARPPTALGQGSPYAAARPEDWLPPLGTPERAPGPQEAAPWVVRTALCVEPRDGKLFVFLPPVQTAEDYLELLSRVEDTADDLSLPVIIEGYPPPHDPRLNVLKVTPDPGVIEVNIHPAKSWDEMVRNTEGLYEEARLARLGTEKFMVDGRHTGTGGGNHIVVGGETPADSPFLRRPDLLASLIAYWHHHPALSYVFSGLFIGPTSQSPRADEARDDVLHELELAFAELRRQRGGPTPPWLVDRVLRHLLTDVTGNTHRAEFCIDKLYSPDSASGRLGLLELRNFEMPPHARMSLAQQLLMRGLIAKFWEEPYAPARLTRWGTALHDRFMLPHFLRQDLHDVVDDLRGAGLPFAHGWFEPHLEFRFPVIGDLAQRGLEVELRTALEPWHVLGEEGAAGGTVRFVDSSVERLQVRVEGWNPERYALAVNGWRVPLQPTGTSGEFVAGVRYKAWMPPSALHPTIPVDAPLVFDLVDLWNARSLGGCTYHVAHPGGRSHDAFPVNSYEAESRRLARFHRLGHTGGKLRPVVPPRVSPEFPLTLDLRQQAV